MIRRFGSKACCVWLAMLPLVGCQGLPNESTPADRQYDPAPFTRLMEDESAGEDEEAEEPDAWPNSQSPGPDLANFPNSAFTVPRNAFQIELAPVSLEGPSDDVGSNYTTQFLLRYGLTDRLELRMFGSGFAAITSGPARTTGFAPFAFDLKMNFWDESKNHLIPAVGLEVFVETEFGSPVFRSGTQPGLILLFDHTLPWDVNFEWNVGMNGAQAETSGKDKGDINGPINVLHTAETNALEWNLQWALQRRFYKKFDVFTHGYLNSSVIPSLGDGIVVGAGGIYQLTQRLTVFGSYNAGLTRDSPTTFFQLGFSAAF